MYHGAEHKTIYCYESGLELTVENAKKFTTLHPRCGTNFLFIVMATSIILFSFPDGKYPFLEYIEEPDKEKKYKKASYYGCPCTRGSRRAS